jgi:hypothetical protein
MILSTVPDTFSINHTNNLRAILTEYYLSVNIFLNKRILPFFVESYSVINAGGIVLKNEMYTYHYFRNRCIIRPTRSPEYLVQTAVLSGLIYAGYTLIAIFR